ncbi:SDR family oxidoreductase [Pseudoalteromonas piratica]|uniref:Short-chain dehydrogenase n=1 Tax=Pseudoalteromonas piratica TaxID=1348114 RepID=A0A0A7ELJ2_9GAMM|nr:SDR family oxidoreductase [Pseudoalteromonas piratica]AIY67499.1 short-chain dehydrogenase [Pseudoalteromonas piratica]
MRLLITLFILTTHIAFADDRQAALEASHAKAASVQNQKAILVTGASSGIGRTITETLARQGHFVFAGARKQKDIDALNQLTNVQAIRLDVTIQSDIDAAVNTVKASGKQLHGLVNNAGVAVFGPLIEIPERDIDFQDNVNVMGPYRITKAFAPLIIENKGRIANIGSISGLMSSTMFGPYSMTKHAIEAFSEALSAEMRKFGVKVSVIAPGNYNSNIMKNLKRRLEKQGHHFANSRYQDEYKRFAKFTNPDRSRFKAPDDVANAVVKALFDETPHLRYLVVPNEQEAMLPIKNTLKKVAELNASHAFTFDKKQMLAWLSHEIDKANQ